MQHYVQLAVSALILLAVSKAVEESPPGTVPDASQCTVSLMQTDLRMKILQEEPAPYSPDRGIESEADDTARAQLAEKDKTATKSSSEDKVSSDTDHLVELKASSEYMEKSRSQQATSKEQSKTIDVRLNSELQTQSHLKADNIALKAHDTAPEKLAQKDQEASSDAEHLVELKASSEYGKKSRPQQATSKKQSKTIDVRLNSELQTQSHEKADNTAPTQLAEKDKEVTKSSNAIEASDENLVELKASSEYETKSRSEADSKKGAQVGTIDVRLSSQLQLDASAKARSSSTAQTVAWLKNMVHDSDGGLLIMLFVGTLACICMTLVLMGTKMQDPNDKDIYDRPLPAGYNARPTSLNSAMAVPGANRANPVRLLPRPTPQQSLLPQSQRTLPSQQRTPITSSIALPPGANMMDDLQKSSSGSGELPQPGIRYDLPPICPSLILPHTEARFMIQMDHLKRSWLGPLNILGTSGRKLLHALVCDTPDNRRCLMLASCGCEDDPRTCIFTPADATDPQAELEVFGKSGKFYGWLEFPGGNQALLTHSGNDGETNRVLQIDMGNATDLRMSASTMDGKLLASAGRSVAGQTAEGKDTWKMQVKPGTDAVLITSCMLALIVLKPWPSGDGRISLPSKGHTFTPQGTATNLRHTAEHEPAPRRGY